MSAATSQPLVVGIEAMDDQHGILLDTLNELRQQLVRGNSKARLNLQLARLIEFADMHFACEESMLRRHGFPDLDDHCVAHQALLDQIRYAVHRADHGTEAELQQSLGFLRGQYMDHVDRFDRGYAEWLHLHGVC